MPRGGLSQAGARLSRRKDCGQGASGAERAMAAAAYALALAMRYVIVILTITFFLIWDGLYNQGRYLDIAIRDLTHVVRYVTGKS